MGKKIVKLFDDPGDNDITLNWMSNYLAELLLKLEKEGDAAEKERLQKEVFDTIIQLWQNRKHFPPGHVPLGSMSNLLDVLRSFDDSDQDSYYWRRMRPFENSASWGEYLRALRNSIEQSLELTVSLVASLDILRKEQEWKEHIELLEEDEKKLVNWIDSVIDGGQSNEIVRIIVKHKGLDESEGEKSRIEKAFKKLRELHEEQGKRLDSFEKVYLARSILVPNKRRKKKS